MSIIRNKVFLRISIAVLSVLLIGTVCVAVTVNSSNTLFITAQVNSAPPVGGGGGGAGGGSSSGTGTTVNFSGMGSPSSKVFVLQDGVQVLSTIADPEANFSASVTNLMQGNYTFALYAQDKNGNRSALFSFPVYITTGATINIRGVILAPTIDVEQSEVRRGENEPIFGFTVPNSTVNITVHSGEAHFVTATTGDSGAYLYNFDTTPLEYGDHNAKSRSLFNQKVSAETNPVSFIVSNQTKPKTPSCSDLIGDLNCDGKVNLVDFSILAYWYKKGTLPPDNVDLNSDGRINLVDFSIMAYHWTG
ncbi:MAG: hypothetical protein JWL92_306 [Candidatus Nomurabacteria bacterium]|nr:hypothetical protein [Candidatus Nomurabacteria bacterium]